MGKGRYFGVVLVVLFSLLHLWVNTLAASPMQQSDGTSAPDSWREAAGKLAEDGKLNEAASAAYEAFDEARSKADPDGYLIMRYFVDSLTIKNDRYAGKVSFQTQVERITGSINLADQLGKQSILSNEYYYYGVLLRTNGQYDSAFRSFEKATFLAEELGDDRLILISSYQMTVCLTSEGKFEEALKLANLFLDRSIALNDTVNIQTAYEKLGNMHHYNLKNQEKAREYTLKALEIALHAGIDPSYSYGTLGSIYVELDSLDKSLKMYQKAIDATGDLYAVAGYSLHLAYVYMDDRSLYDSAIHYFDIAYQAADQINYKLYQAYARGGAAICRTFLGDPASAIPDLLYNYQILSEFQDNEFKLDTYRGLSFAYETAGNYQASLRYFQEFKALSDSLYNIQKYEAVSEIETKYETEKKEQQITLLSKENELQEARLIGQQQQKTAFLIGGVLLAIILIVTVVALINKHKSNALINQQKLEIEHTADQLRASNLELNELSGFKETFTSMIAHDMKNALNSIIGFSESDIFDRKMKKINHSGHVMLNLVTNMLDVQKFEEAGYQPVLRSTRLSQIVEEARLQVALLFQEKSLSLHIELDKDYSLQCDMEVMTRVLVNLLSNAAKYSKPGRPVFLSVSASEQVADVVEIQVRDEGDGITPEQLPYVFEKYWQGASKFSGRAASTGLGLTFCRLAVEAHNGLIEVASREGEGTSFQISLPTESVIDHFVSTEQVAATFTLADTTPSERRLMQQYVKTMSELEVYQVGEINKVLEEMSGKGLGNGLRKSIEHAVQLADEEHFRHLMSQLLDEQPDK